MIASRGCYHDQKQVSEVQEVALRWEMIAFLEVVQMCSAAPGKLDHAPKVVIELNTQAKRGVAEPASEPLVAPRRFQDSVGPM